MCIWCNCTFMDKQMIYACMPNISVSTEARHIFVVYMNVGIYRYAHIYVFAKVCAHTQHTCADTDACTTYTQTYIYHVPTHAERTNVHVQSSKFTLPDKNTWQPPCRWGRSRGGRPEQTEWGCPEAVSVSPGSLPLTAAAPAIIVKLQSCSASLIL